MRISFKALVFCSAIAAPVLVYSLGAISADAGSQVQARQQNFKSMARAFKLINDELKKDTPAAAAIKSNAATMANIAPQLPTWFPKGSGPETGLKTRAKPEIWSNPAEFADLAAKLKAEVLKLQQTADGGDMAAIRTQVQATGGACKACHDKFRGPEEQ